MKLSTTELDYIDRYLEQQKLDFIDFKIEVKDHLACETEVFMKEQQISFENAFFAASKSWDKSLKVRKFWIISNERLFPEIVIQKIKNRVIIHYFFVLITAFFLTMLCSNLDIKTIPSLKYIVPFCGLLHLVLTKFTNTKKINTSYRFHFNYFHLPVVLFFIHFFFFQKTLIITNFIGFLIVANFPFIIYYFIKHQQFVKKYNLT
jgi:hypothetical protein